MAEVGVERAGNFHAIRSKFEFLTINQSAKIAPISGEKEVEETVPCRGSSGARKKPTRQGSFTFGTLGRDSPTSTIKGVPVSVLIAREMAARSSTRAQPRDSGYNSFTLATPARERTRTNYRLLLRPACATSVHPTALHYTKSPSPPVSPRRATECMPSPTLSDMQQFTRSMSNLANCVPYTISSASVSVWEKGRETRDMFTVCS